MAPEYVTDEKCQERTIRILEALEELNRRLYRDNGHISIQTRLDRHERVLRAMMWVVTMAGAATITLFIGVFWRVMARAL